MADGPAFLFRRFVRAIVAGMDEAPALVETYRGGVAAWECDAFGHLNIAFYVERFADAALDFLERGAPGRRWRTLALDTFYDRELRAGEGLAIRSGLVSADENSVLLAHEASATASGERMTRVEHILAPVAGDLSRILLPAPVAWERFPAPSLPTGEGRIPAGRNRVKPWEAAEGSLALLGFVHRFSDACLHVIEAIGMTDTYRRSANRGFATFETRLRMVERAAVGEGVVITSGVVAVGTSSLRMLHRLRATGDNRLLAQFYQAGVHFDLASRRSAPWSQVMRERAESLAIAGD
jgi:acyl-CoA thioesterase FadM